MKWRGAKSKNRRKSWLTVLCCKQPNKVSCINHSNTPGISMLILLKEAKRKQKWRTFARIHRLTYQQNTLLCAPSILKHRFSRSLLIGTQVDFKRSGKRSVPTMDAKGKDSLDNDYPRNEGTLANRFSPIKFLWTFLWDPTGIQNSPTPTPPPPQKKKK